jgi:hypothetical protein
MGTIATSTLSAGSAVVEPVDQHWRRYQSDMVKKAEITAVQGYDSPEKAAD